MMAARYNRLSTIITGDPLPILVPTYAPVSQHTSPAWRILLLCVFSIVIAACATTGHSSGTHPHSQPGYHSQTGDMHTAHTARTYSSNLWPKLSQALTLTYPARQADVHYYLNWYQQHPNAIHQLAEQAKPYLYYVFQQTQQRHLPAEVSLLPMVESNYQPFSISTTGATGLWQLMPGTASGHGLRINWWVDNRRNITASTQAALDYLSYLHHRFGNWLLAIAAYDSGEGTVEKAIQLNRAHHRPTDYWSLPLPTETKSYLPKLLALATLIKHAEAYHISLPSIRNAPYFKRVTAPTQLTIDQIAQLSGISTTLVRELNPAYRRWATEPNHPAHLLLPQQSAPLFLTHLHASPHHVTWLHYRVASGDALSQIATHYHTRLVVLTQLNHLQSTQLHPGQQLIVPKNLRQLPSTLSTTGTTHPTHPAPAHAMITEDHRPGPTQIRHTIKRFDNLWQLARHYHVSVAALQYWNDLSYNTPLSIGKVIVIWKSHDAHDHPHPSQSTRLHAHAAAVHPVAARTNTVTVHYHTTLSRSTTSSHSRRKGRMTRTEWAPPVIIVGVYGHGKRRLPHNDDDS